MTELEREWWSNISKSRDQADYRENQAYRRRCWFEWLCVGCWLACVAIIVGCGVQCAMTAN